MDVSKKKAVADIQDTIDQADPRHSSSSGNDNPDPLSRANLSDEFQPSSRSVIAVSENTCNPKAAGVTSTTSILSQGENHKISTSTTNVISQEQEFRIEISGKLIIIINNYYIQ